MANSMDPWKQFFPSKGRTQTTEAPQYSAPAYTQIYNPNGPGYQSPAGLHDAFMNQYETKRQDGIQKETQDYVTRMGAISNALGMGGGSGGGGGFIGGGGSGGGGGVSASAPMMNDDIMSHIPGIEAPDMTASNAATFGRAKDAVGRTSRASLQSLRDELGASGTLGSGQETQGTRDIIQGGMGQLGDTERENAVYEAGQKADFAKTKYQGDITQRGQDIAQQEAAARLALEKQLAQQQLLLAALKGLSGGGGSSGGSSGGGGGSAPPRGGGGGGVVLY